MCLFRAEFVASRTPDKVFWKMISDARKEIFGRR